MDRDNSPRNKASLTARQTSTATDRCASTVDAPICGMSTEMRRRSQRVSRAQRLRGVDVQSRAGQMPPVQRLRERPLVHDAATRQIRDDRAGREPAEFPRTDHPARLVRERGVHGEDQRLAEQLVERRGTARSERMETGIADIGVVRHDRHRERVRSHRNLTTNASQPDDAERASAKFAAHEGRPVPCPFVHRLVRLRDVPHQAEHRPEEQLRDSHRVAGRRIDNRDSQFRGEIDGDVVHAHTGPAHHGEPRRRSEQLRGDTGRAPADQCVVDADPREELVSRKCGHLIDREVRLCGQQGDPFGVNVVGYENPVRHLNVLSVSGNSG